MIETTSIIMEKGNEPQRSIPFYNIMYEKKISYSQGATYGQ